MTDSNNSKERNNVKKEIKELVITRIEAQMSPNLRLSIGNQGSLNANEMIEHVKKGDEIGKQIIESHLRFIRAQASGHLLTALTSVFGE